VDTGRLERKTANQEQLETGSGAREVVKGIQIQQQKDGDGSIRRS